MTYVRSLYGTKDDAHMKAESLMPSKILGATAAGADVDKVGQRASSLLDLRAFPWCGHDKAGRLCACGWRWLHEDVSGPQGLVLMLMGPKEAALRPAGAKYRHPIS
jgi:hypothetical protein